MSYPKAGLFRIESDDQGTIGRFIASDDFERYTIELPWRDNRPNESCIPAGTYLAVPRTSAKYGKHYHITHVDGRSYILAHPANLAGDKSLGYACQLAGCIAPGKKRGKIRGQKAVFLSRVAMADIIRHFNWQPFELTIKDAYQRQAWIS